MKKDPADRKAAVLAALHKSRGIIAPALEAAGVQSRTTFYNWCESDPEFAAAYEQILEAQKDHVESKLIDRINNNDTTAIIFYSKTKMKDRGYQENAAVTVNDSNGAIGDFDPIEALRRIYGKETKQ